MKINYEWLKLKNLDEEILRKFCSTNNEVEFCWWVSGDIGSDNETYDEIVSLIQESIDHKKSFEWRGNSDILEIQSDEIAIFNPMHKKRIKFLTSEFMQELNRWKVERKRQLN